MKRDGARWWCGLGAWLGFSLVGCGESVRHDVSGGPNTGDARARTGQIVVVDDYELPYANTPLLVDGTVVTTDVDGYAPLPSIGDSYDVSFVAPPMAFTFVGLTTRAPVVRAQATTDGNGASSISVDILLAEELGADRKLVYSAGFSDRGSVIWSASDTNGVSFDAYWSGGSLTTFSAEAFIVEIDPATGTDLAFSEYAVSSWTVAPGDTITWTPVFEPAAFETKPIHVDVTLPSGAQLDSYSAWAVEESGRRSSFDSASPSLGSDVLVPDLPDTTYVVEASATTRDQTSEFTAKADGIHAGDRATLEISDGPVQLAPDDGAVVTPDTDFAWTLGRPSVGELVVSASSPNGIFTYVIATSDGHAQIPDLGPLGMSFPAWNMNWAVVTLEGPTSIDDFAAGASADSWGLTGERHAIGSAP